MTRKAYEWERDIEKKNIENRIHWLTSEIKRIATTTLRGNFSKIEDKKYWEDRLRKLNSELLSLENYYQKLKGDLI